MCVDWEGCAVSEYLSDFPTLVRSSVTSKYRQIHLRLARPEGRVEILEKYQKYCNISLHIISFTMIQIYAWQVNFHLGKLNLGLLVRVDKLKPAGLLKSYNKRS